MLARTTWSLIALLTFRFTGAFDVTLRSTNSMLCIDDSDRDPESDQSSHANLMDLVCNDSGFAGLSDSHWAQVRVLHSMRKQQQRLRPRDQRKGPQMNAIYALPLNLY